MTGISELFPTETAQMGKRNSVNQENSVIALVSNSLQSPEIYMGSLAVLREIFRPI